MNGNRRGMWGFPVGSDWSEISFTSIQLWWALGLICFKSRRVGKQHVCCTAEWPLPTWTRSLGTKLCTDYQRNRHAGTSLLSLSQQLAWTSRHWESCFGSSFCSAENHEPLKTQIRPSKMESSLKMLRLKNVSKPTFVVFTFALWFFLLLGLTSSICPLKPWRLETLLVFSWWRLMALCNPMTPGISIEEEKVVTKFWELPPLTQRSSSWIRVRASESLIVCWFIM